MHALVFLNAVGAGGIYRNSKWLSIPVLPASPTLFWFHNQHFFSLSPSEPAGGAAEGLRQDFTCITGETTRRPPSCFWRGGTHRITCAKKKKKKCDSSACWLSAVGARRPLLCSCAMKQIYRLPSGVSSGLDCGSECPVPGFVRSPPFSSSSSILCFKGCRSSDMQTATH